MSPDEIITLDVIPKISTQWYGDSDLTASYTSTSPMTEYAIVRNGLTVSNKDIYRNF